MGYLGGDLTCIHINKLGINRQRLKVIDQTKQSFSNAKEPGTWNHFLIPMSLLNYGDFKPTRPKSSVGQC